MFWLDLIVICQLFILHIVCLRGCFTVKCTVRCAEALGGVMNVTLIVPVEIFMVRVALRRSSVCLLVVMCCFGVLVSQADGLQDSLGAEKKVKGRTGWPQQVWALELNQWPSSTTSSSSTSSSSSSSTSSSTSSSQTLDWNQIKTTDCLNLNTLCAGKTERIKGQHGQKNKPNGWTVMLLLSSLLTVGVLFVVFLLFFFLSFLMFPPLQYCRPDVATVS